MSTICIFAFLSISAVFGRAEAYDLMLSLSPDRSNPVTLSGATVSGNIYVFTSPDTGVVRVSFYLDDPSMVGAPFQVEGYGPFDFAGTGAGTLANPYNADQLAGGQHTITAKVELSGGSIQLLNATFSIPSSTTLNPYLQDSGTDGIVSIEVENFDANTSRSGYSWVKVTPTGYSGTGAMQAQPNAGTNMNTGFVTTSPRLDYKVNFVKTGTHHVWIRGLGATIGDDSLHVGLDGAAVASSDRITQFASSWTWSKSTIDVVVATINVTSTGVHTLNVWMREDGFVMDKIVLTTNSSYTPAGVGPDESTRGNALVLSPQSLVFSVVQGGTASSQTISLSANTDSAVAYTVSDSATWLAVSPVSGTTPGSLTAAINATGLAAGTYTATITAASSGYASATASVTLTVSAVQTQTVQYSSLPDRSAAAALNGKTLGGTTYIFLSPESGVSRVSFYLDDATMSGAPYQVDDLAPFDFNGTDIGVVGAVDGLIAMEAEHYFANVAQGGKSWTATYPAGYAGQGAMIALPNTGTNNNTGYVTTSPRLDFNVNFPQTGTYYVWVRGSGPTLADDSLHIGLNGVAVAGSDRITQFLPSWTWSSATIDGPVATLNIPSVGYHKVNAWMREDGFVLDKLVLSRTAACSACTGTGPAEIPYAVPLNTRFLANGSHTIAARLELSDGSTKTVQAAFTVSNTATAFMTDTFGDGNATGWSTVNDDGYASSWAVVSGAYQQQTAIVNPGAFDGSYHLGKYALYTAGTDWLDYRFSVDVTPLAERGDDIGIMFRYQDNDNYYRLSMSARYGYTRLEKKVDGVFSPLFTNARGYLIGRQVRLEVEANGDFFFVYIDGDLVFACQDKSLRQGGVALFTSAEARFDNVAVESLGSEPVIAVSSPTAFSVKTNNSLNLVALAKNMPAGSDVELLLDAAGCADPVQSSTGVLTTQCTNLVRGDHILTAAINASGMEVAADLNDAVGTSGNYFIAVGDSITNGRGDNRAFDNISLDERIVAMQGFEAPLADQLSASGLNPVIIFNEGIGGDESYDAAYTRISSILARHPGSNKVLLMLGTNDSGVPVLSGLGCSGTSCNGTYKQNMQNLINSIRALGKTVYVALVPPAFTTATPLGSSRNNLIQQYNTVIKTELTDIQVQRPDFFSYFLTSSVNRFSLFEDDLHTNALGYLAMTHLWHNALTGTTTLPFILDDLTPSTVSPYLKQNLLEVEDLYYVDETFTLTAIPPALGAGRWVMTANSGKTNTSAEYLSFSVAGNVTVYIAYDANAASPPNWLKNDFTATGTQLTTTNPAAPQMKLYASNTARTGTISLGGNLATGASGAQANYIVIVVQN